MPSTPNPLADMSTKNVTFLDGSPNIIWNNSWFHKKKYLECSLIQWRLSIYPWCTQVAVGTLFMKSPVDKYFKL